MSHTKPLEDLTFKDLSDQERILYFEKQPKRQGTQLLVFSCQEKARNIERHSCHMTVSVPREGHAITH